MRLGQLARKISIRQADMVEFLAKSGVAINNESNARLEDEQVQVILHHFAPSFLNEKIEEVEPILPEVEVQEETKIVAAEENEPIQESILFKAETPSVEESKEEKIEVIKAPKVDLPGLKVIGKIELPEPKKKEVLPVEEAEKSETPVLDSKANIKPRAQRSPRNVQDNRRERTNGSAVNPVARQRERDAQAAEEKRRADAIREKEKRTEYYLNRVKANAPTKPARIYSEPVDHYNTSTTKKEAPKTLFGKFLRWLTS